MLKSKKAISIIICLTMALSVFVVFTGCRPFEFEVDWSVDVHNVASRPQMNLLFPESHSGFGTGHTANIIEQKTGYRARYTQAVGGDTDINNALVAQTPFHAMKLTQAQFDPHVVRGRWLDLTPILEETDFGRTLYQIIDLLPGAWDSVRWTDPETGHTGIYAIPETGFVTMIDQALIWNMQHLAAIGWFDAAEVAARGHDCVPATTGEFNDAVYRLQAHFGPADHNYFAFAVPGTHSAEVEPLMISFGIEGFRFFMDEDDRVQSNFYSDAVMNYAVYMNQLLRDGIIPRGWQSLSSGAAMGHFAQERSSVIYLPYWEVIPLIEMVIDHSHNILGRYNMVTGNETREERYRIARNDLLRWNTKLRGDGTHGSVVQEEGMRFGGFGGSAWYVVIPLHMSRYALFTIHYMSVKLQNFNYFYAGLEGVDWNRVNAPADGLERPEEGIVWKAPWSFEVDGQLVEGGGMWVQLTSSYRANIMHNSQYMTGQNILKARSLFRLREVGFDAWQVAHPPYIDGDGNPYLQSWVISSPMEMHPVFEFWSPISIASRTAKLFSLARAIDAPSEQGARNNINYTRNALMTSAAQSLTVLGVRYQFWSDAIRDEMTYWYWNVRRA